jgi:hypothetical protein
MPAPQPWPGAGVADPGHGGPSGLPCGWPFARAGPPCPQPDAGSEPDGKTPPVQRPRARPLRRQIRHIRGRAEGLVYRALRRSQVAAAERATVLSVRSLILQLAGALGAVAMGGLAVLTNTAAAFGVPAVVLAVPGWLLGTAANAEPTRADRRPEPVRNCDRCMSERGRKAQEPRRYEVRSSGRGHDGKGRADDLISDSYHRAGVRAGVALWPGGLRARTGGLAH